MASDAADETDRRGNPKDVAILFVGLTVVGTLVLLSQGEHSPLAAIGTAVAGAIPFTAYAWYIGWGA